jgi:hypothetical protein
MTDLFIVMWVIVSKTIETIKNSTCSAIWKWRSRGKDEVRVIGIRRMNWGI